MFGSILWATGRFSDKDMSREAQAARRISGFADLDGIAFVARIDIGIELFGDLYPITDEWTGSFSGRVYPDPLRNSFG